MNMAFGQKDPTANPFSADTCVGVSLRTRVSAERGFAVGSSWPKAIRHRSLGQRPRIKIKRAHWPKAIVIRRGGARLVPDVLLVELNAVAREHRPILVLKRLMSMMFLLVSDIMFRLIAVFRTD